MARDTAFKISVYFWHFLTIDDLLFYFLFSSKINKTLLFLFRKIKHFLRRQEYISSYVPFSSQCLFEFFFKVVKETQN